MAGNKTLELSIKIAGKVDKSLINAINAAQSNVSSLSTTLSKVGTVGLAAMGTLATGTVAALAKCTDAAKDFESQMSDVVKYVDGLADKNGEISDKFWGRREVWSNGAIRSEAFTYAENYAIMKDAILDLSTQIPYTAEELTKLAAAAGQSGKSMDDLTGGFLKDVAMMGTAWDISADQAGDWAAKWEVAFDKSHKEIMTLADQINYLGANNATTAAEIAQVVNEAAGLGQVAGMDVDATAALGTAMLAMGVDTAKAANSINRMYTNMSKGASATKAQQEMWKELGFTATEIAASMQNDASGTMLQVFEAIQQLPDERQVAALSTLFGQWAITGAAKLTGNLDTFKQALSDVDNKDLFNGSMNREFIIKASTSEAIDSMMANAFQAMKIDVGTAFLPAKKEISVALIDFMNQLRSMPELGEIAQQLATLFSQGVSGAAETLENAMPAIQKFLNYLVNNGPQVLSFLGKLAAAFTAMKFAPGIESLLRGAGGLVFDSKTGGSTHTGSGGIVGLMGNLFRGGQAAGTAVRNTPGAISGVLDTARGVIGTAKIDAQLSGKSLLGTLFSVASTPLGNTGVGQYIQNVGSAAGGFGSAIANATSGAGAITLNSSPLSTLASGLSSVGGAGLNLAGTALSPLISGLGSIVAGAAPVILAISGIIAVLSLLWDNMDMLRGPIEAVFGEQGLAVFDSFKSGLDGVFSFIQGLFDGGLADTLSPLRDSFGNLLEGSGLLSTIFGGAESGLAAFDGVVVILQSVLGIVGDIVAFANTTVKPIIQDIFTFITGTALPMLVSTFSTAAPTIASIITNVGGIVMTVVRGIGTVIQALLPSIQTIITAVLNIANAVIPVMLQAINMILPVIQGIIDVLIPIISVAISTIGGYISGVATTISEVIGGIMEILSGLIDFIEGVFTGNWEQVWNGVADIFGGIFDTLAALAKAPINAVIGIINGAISGINSLGLTIPDWVPVIGGKSFSLNIPQMPMLAKGGFTNGPSIAGEAGTEAVISFQRSARASNIATWTKAGQMLGVSNKPARLETFDTDDGGPGWPTGNGGGPVTITYAPTIIIQGNASKEDVDAALRDDKARFDAWYEEKKRNERRTRW